MIMKPYEYKRLGKGYCCEWDDGPYSLWKKNNRRSHKRSDKNLAKKEVANELQGSSAKEEKRSS